MTCLGEIIRECRKIEGKSLEAVARLSGITKSHVHDLEIGKSRNPTIDTIMRLCHALRIAPSRLLNPAVEDWRSRRPEQEVILIKTRVKMDGLK